MSDHYKCECGMNVLCYKQKEHLFTKKHYKKLRVVKLDNELEDRKNRITNLKHIVPNKKVKVKTTITKRG